MAVEKLAKTLGISLERKGSGFIFGEKEAEEGKGRSGKRWILARSTRFMNECGPSVASALKKFFLEPDSLLLATDDIDLSLGTIRLRPGGSSGGHRGLESVIASLGTEKFARLRIGIGPVPAGQDPAEFVLRPFLNSERPVLEKTLEQAVACLRAAVTESLERAMTRYNRAHV